MVTILPLSSMDLSKHQVDAFIAFRMLSFPIPPLPLVALRGGDLTDSSGSSSDLIIRAMQVNYIDPPTHEKTLNMAADVAKMKEEMLKNMILDIARIWQDHVSVPYHERSQKFPDLNALNECYNIFQQAFRDYMKHYPGSDDVRFYPASYVDNNTTVHKQTVQFLKNTASCVADDDNVLSDLSSQLLPQLTYIELLLRYIRELHYIVYEASDE